MRRLLLTVHFYGGLACFWYLMILGISSLNYNHHFDFMNVNYDTVRWTKQVAIAEPREDNDDYAQELRDSLDLIGWPLFWETQRDSSGRFHTVVEQPGKRYIIDYDQGSRQAVVIEARKGFWRVFNALHGFGSIPGAPFMHVWSWYTRITVVVVIASVLTGIYVWYKGTRDKRSGTLTLTVSVVGALTLMVYLYLVG